MQTSFGLIFLLFFQLSPVFSNEIYTQKDLLDLRTDAWTLYNTSQPDRALELLLSVPKEYRTEEIYVIMANIYEDKGDTDKALDMLNLAICANPKYYKAYYNYGTVYIKRKSWDLAIRNLKLSIKYDKEFPYSHYNLGYCYLQLAEYKKAKRSFIKAITLKQDDKNFYQSLAYTYKMLGKKKSAKKVLDAYNKF